MSPGDRYSSLHLLIADFIFGLILSCFPFPLPFFTAALKQLKHLDDFASSPLLERSQWALVNNFITIPFFPPFFTLSRSFPLSLSFSSYAHCFFLNIIHSIFPGINNTHRSISKFFMSIRV